jgi:hypothetical protein
MSAAQTVQPLSIIRALCYRIVGCEFMRTCVQNRLPEPTVFATKCYSVLRFDS